jgi:hypothetical protein
MAIAVAPGLAESRHFTKNIVSREIGYRSVADLNVHVTALRMKSCQPARLRGK